MKTIVFTCDYNKLLQKPNKLILLKIDKGKYFQKNRFNNAALNFVKQYFKVSEIILIKTIDFI